MTDDHVPHDRTVMPGRQLRQAREERGLSLEEAARRTCIGISYLEALEEERYEDLPNPAYVKGIIRSYARILGISPEPLIARYTQGAEPEEGDEEPSPARPPLQGRRSWLLLLLAGIVVCIGYLVAQRDTGQIPVPAPSDRSLSVPLPAQVVLQPRSSQVRSVSPPVSPAAVLPRDEGRGESQTPAVPSKSVLKVKIIADCQLTMTIDDMPSQQYDLKQGDLVEWIGERYFALEVTNAGAIEAELNGKPLPSLGRSGDATTAVISADGQIE